MSAASTSIVPRVDLSGTWTDNFGLTGSNQQSAEIWQLAPGLSFTHDSPFEHAVLDYQARELYFTAGQYGDQHALIHSGSLFSDTKLIPQWFDLDLAGLRTQSAANPTQAVNNNYLFPTQNVANSTSGSIEPILRHSFRLLKIDAEYTRSFSHNQQQQGQPTDLFANSNVSDAQAGVASVDAKAPVTWSARYERTQTDYNLAGFQPYKNEIATADLGYLLTPSIRLLAHGGKESDPFLGVSTGGLGSTFWAAGFDWSPDKNNDLKVLAGRRFFGNSYEAHWRHQSRLLNVQANYTEQPATQDGLLASQSLTPQQAIQPLNIPGQQGFVRVSPDVFLQKQLDARVALTGRLTAVGVTIESQQRTYITVNGVQVPQSGGAVADDRERSVSVFATRRLGPVTQAQLIASYSNVDLREGTGYQYKDKLVTASISRRLGAWTALSLLAEHDERSGGITPYKVNMVTLDFNMTFGHTPGQGPMGTSSITGGGLISP